MGLIEINKSPTNRELRQFAWIWFPAFCLLAGGVSWLKFAAITPTIAFMAAGGVVILLGVFSLQHVRLTYLGWMYAAFPIGWVMSHLMLAAIYYLVITPIGVCLRLVGHDPLPRGFKASSSSYWSTVSESSDIESYFRQF